MARTKEEIEADAYAITGRKMSLTSILQTKKDELQDLKKEAKELQAAKRAAKAAEKAATEKVAAEEKSLKNISKIRTEVKTAINKYGTLAEDKRLKDVDRYVFLFYSFYEQNWRYNVFPFDRKFIDDVKSKQLEKIVERTRKAFGFKKQRSLFINGKAKDAIRLFSDAYGISEEDLRNTFENFANDFNDNKLVTGGTKRDWGGSFKGVSKTSFEKSNKVLQELVNIASDATDLFADTYDKALDNVASVLQEICNTNALDGIIEYCEEILATNSEVERFFTEINEALDENAKKKRQKDLSTFVEYKVRRLIFENLNKVDGVDLEDSDLKKRWEKNRTKLRDALIPYLRLKVALNKIKRYSTRANKLIGKQHTATLEEKQEYNDFTRAMAYLSGILNGIGGTLLERAIADGVPVIFNVIVDENRKMLSTMTGSGVANEKAIVQTHVDPRFAKTEEVKFQNFNKSNPKADVVLSMTPKEYRLYIGVTAKATASLQDVQFEDGHFLSEDISIKAQSSTPLTTLCEYMMLNLSHQASRDSFTALYSEMGALIEGNEKLGITDGNKTNAEARFENIKDALILYNFVDFLAGTGQNVVESAVLLNINGRFFPLFDIVQKIYEQYDINSSRFFSIVNMKMTGGFAGKLQDLNRSVVENANKPEAGYENDLDVQKGKDIRTGTFYNTFYRTKVTTTINLGYIIGSKTF